MSVKISSKYQVVIPESVREHLGFKPGAEVDVIAKGGIAYIVPVRTLKAARGMIKEKITHYEAKTVRQKKDKRNE